jgi:hypothetical protein
MILAVDVAYADNSARAAGVLFEAWHSDGSCRPYSAISAASVSTRSASPCGLSQRIR